SNQAEQPEKVREIDLRIPTSHKDVGTGLDSMSRFFDLVSKPVRDMGNYLPPRPLPPVDSQSPRLIRLDSNENPFGPSPGALEAMRMAIASVNSYPEDDCTELRRKLAVHHALPPEQVLVTAGSTALLALLCQTLLA